MPTLHRFLRVTAFLLPCCLNSCVVLVPFIDSKPAPAGCATCRENMERAEAAQTPQKNLTTEQKRRGYVRYYMLKLNDPDPAVRATAATNLGDYGNLGKPAVPQLLRALHDESKFVRRAAVKSLAKISPESAEVQAALNSARSDRDPWVAHSATRVANGTPLKTYTSSSTASTTPNREIIRAPKSPK